MEYRDSDWLVERYVGRGMSLSEMADEAGSNVATIHYWMEKHGIERRSQSEAQIRDHRVLDKDWLENLYVEKRMSLRKIAAESGLSATTIRSWMEKHGIERRDFRYGLSPGAPFTVHERGYEYWRSQFDNKVDSCHVHDLVAIAHGADPHKVFSPNYVVHHKNGMPRDNRPGNLELLPKSEHAHKHSWWAEG